MDEVIYYNNLYDCYKDLLTDKQQSYFVDYYQDNLSLSEMADNYGISRNAIHRQIKKITELLDFYESKLCIISKNNQIMGLINETKNDKLIKEIERIIEG
jgi:hypothetical protein